MPFFLRNYIEHLREEWPTEKIDIEHLNVIENGGYKYSIKHEKLLNYMKEIFDKNVEKNDTLYYYYAIIISRIHKENYRKAFDLLDKIKDKENQDVLIVKANIYYYDAKKKDLGNDLYLKAFDLNPLRFISKYTDKGQDIIHYAIENNLEYWLDKIEKYKNIIDFDKNDYGLKLHPLISAYKKGNYSILKKLLKLGSNPLKTNEELLKEDFYFYYDDTNKSFLSYISELELTECLNVTLDYLSNLDQIDKIIMDNVRKEMNKLEIKIPIPTMIKYEKFFNRNGFNFSIKKIKITKYLVIHREKEYEDDKIHNLEIFDSKGEAMKKVKKLSGKDNDYYFIFTSYGFKEIKIREINDFDYEVNY